MIRSPLAGWVGGKFHLSKTIVELIPEHTGYVEPFAGGAWVLFRKPESKAEILNDINRDVTNLYRIIQHHLEEFIKQFKWILTSRDEFDKMKKRDPETLTDIQRAARFYYLQKMSFGGKITKDATFGTTVTRPPRLNLLRIEEELSAAHLRLSRVLVENLGYQELIKRYDREKTFFYIDPPYFGCEDYYGKEIFSRDDFQKLADQLAGIQGKFLLSINDVPEIREIFGDFTIDAADTFYSLSVKKNTKVTELLVRNY